MSREQRLAFLRGSPRAAMNPLEPAVENPTRPDSTRIQSVLFKKEDFTAAKARAWLKRNDFEVPAVDETENMLRFRQQDPDAFQKGSFRTITLTEGVEAVVGRPVKQVRKNGEHESRAWWRTAEHDFPEAYDALLDTLSSQSTGKGIAKRREAARKKLVQLMVSAGHGTPEGAIQKNPSPSDQRAADLYARLVVNRQAWASKKYGWDRFELIHKKIWEDIEREPLKVKEHVWMLIHAENRARDLNAAELASWKKNPVDLSRFDQDQVKRGIEEETKEHGKKLAPRVVADHLALDPHYYSKDKGAGRAAGVITIEKVTVEKTTAVVAAEAKRNPATGKPITGKQHMTRKQAERGFKGSTNREWNAYLDKLRSDGRIWQNERDAWTMPKKSAAKKNPAPQHGMQEWGYVWRLDCIDPKMKPFKIEMGQREWIMWHDPDGDAWPKNEALVMRYTLTDEHEIDPKDVPRSMRKYAGRGPIYGGEFMAPSGADWKLAGVVHHIWYERVGTKHPGHWQHPYGEKGEPLPQLYVWTYKSQTFYRLALGKDAVWNVRGFVTP